MYKEQCLFLTTSSTEFCVAFKTIMHIYTSVNLLRSSRPKPLPGLTVSRYTVLLLRKICLKCLFYGAFI